MEKSQDIDIKYMRLALDEANKKVDAAIKEYDNGKTELRNKFQSHYRFEWDNPFNRIRSVERR